ncbi:hypothetical protein [Amycolatopsis taiwanensis]|uniref:Uncharacterized protein n=1 Tax=Amycolatopsis taiwanensis TaxID=342230 RepID=A0A9W6QWE5_9PSEU|nr:hypothetical protein [Amycolatopsis taiwanensis]GLY64968.1 hypothetical protein Atai01_15870 [Amycolatopsis taiwanensis]
MPLLFDGELYVDYGQFYVESRPPPPAADVVIRQTSERAAYWHACARELPPPPTPAQRAEARRQQRLAGRQKLREVWQAAEVRWWGGRAPSERIRRINGALAIALLDRDLLDKIENLDETAQRAIAIWAAGRAYREAGLSDLDWVTPAFAALEHGRPLPRPFDDHDAAWQLLSTDSRVPRTTVASYDGRHDRISQQHAAVPALWSAAAGDPLAAGVETLFHATVTFGSGYPRLFAEVHQEFPVLSTS